MENNEIMNNEVMEATEEVIESAGIGKGLAYVAGGVALSVGGVLVTKYVVLPLSKKVKKYFEQKKLSKENLSKVETEVVEG